jgi:hypothetical protein
MSPRVLYFHNGGWYGMIHHAGAVRELARENQVDNIYYGNSAGGSFALVCYLVLNGYVSIDHIMTEVNKTFDSASLTSLNMTPLFCDFIDIMVPYWPDDLAKRISGIVNIGVSTKSGHRFINQFNTNADIYNTLLCSGTIPGLSGYESIIDGEVCIDGGFLFNINLIPKDAVIIVGNNKSPLSLTFPPAFIRPWIEEDGRRNVIYGPSRPLSIKYRTPFFMISMFLLHELWKKDMQISQYIEKITNSKITRQTN